jgi:ATP-dependent DNA helicase RecG
MAIPISVKDLLKQRKVESERIEFKANWNPESVLHSTCAFANDINNWGGGYIVIGVAEENGVPVLPPAGITKGTAEKISKDLIQICNLLEPRYIPVIDVTAYNGKQLVVLWVSGSNDRPHSCPTKLPEKGANKEKIQRAYYIRKASSSIRANANETRELFEIAARVPFDDRPNQTASLEDLRPALIMNYLHQVESDLYEQSKQTRLEELALSMRIATGAAESIKPLNVGLLFFNERPDNFFRYARIEVVDKPDPTGLGMTEKYFYGPLDAQLRDAMSYIENYIIKAKTLKYNHSAEASRFYNYPIKAVEEALGNAIHHRAYDSYEPVVVTMTPEQLEVLSHPGPDRSITDKDLANRKLVSKIYRNRRIGEYLKELELVEGRNTGIPRMLRSLKENGSEPPIFETDEDRRYFRVIFKIHPSFILSPDERINERIKTTVDSVFEMMVKNPEIRVSEIATELRRAESTIYRAISELKKNGMIKRLGTKKKGYWETAG